ncbi:Endonuclease/exonuclease/phosphatase [Ramicandelaber brevisporus]|nr:Endonuclease/exonuclease/phosphatase [Ramicandelaber brevisporus]
MSYNILAQLLAKSDYFPNSPRPALKQKHRRTLVIDELSHYKPDIACLQEVDGYSDYYQQQFKQLGYDCVYEKADGKKHGCVIMWKRSKFEKMTSGISEEVVVLDNKNMRATHSDVMTESVTAALKSVKMNNVAVVVALRSIEETCEDDPESDADNDSSQRARLEEAKQLKATGKVQVSDLISLLGEVNLSELDEAAEKKREAAERRRADPSSDTRPGIVISNTHLHWGLDAKDDIARLAQAAVISKRVRKLMKKHNLPGLLCGDWNATPNSPLYLALTSRRVNADDLMSEEIKTLLNTYIPPHVPAATDEVQADTTPGASTETEKEKETNGDHGASQRASPTSDEKVHLARQIVDYIGDLDSTLDPATDASSNLRHPNRRSIYSTYSKVNPDHYDGSDRSNMYREYGEPRFTAYDSWNGTLDYIFAWDYHDPEGDVSKSRSVQATHILSIPEEDKIKPGMPNMTFPSDHLSLLTRIKLI